MTIASWCVFLALLAPYLYSVLARTGTPKEDYVRDPRAFNETLSGWHRRAHLAQLNAFEAFPAFAVAVVIAQIAGTPQTYLDLASVAFVVVRVLHGVFYITDQPSLRSVSWQVGMLCIVSIFVLAAIAGSPK